MRKDIKEYIENRISPEPNSGCWLWTGTMTRFGYGRLMYKTDNGQNKAISAHRASYEAYKGKIPEGLVLDHLCRTRLCVNPDHLEPVTQRENVCRGFIARLGRVREHPVTKGHHKHQFTGTHCPNGHELTVENVYVYPEGGHQCRACRREAMARYNQKRKSKLSNSFQAAETNVTTQCRLNLG